jgi:NifU-like protein
MWDYNEKVMDHFLRPRNVGEIENPDGTGEVGNITCGDALKLTFKLDDKGRIADVKFKTFGCASAIASSSALTELVKGMTLDEAAKVTNKDIVKLLGELPEEKMHCSVMGMEALQAAIANHRGEKAAPAADADDHEGAVICKCFGVTDTKIRKIALANNLRTAEQITHYSKAGGGCGCCLDDIQEILDELWKSPPKTAADSKAPLAAAPAMSIVQKVLKIQQVIDYEIRPLLEMDGGSIEFVDLSGDKVIVRLKGRCSACPSATVTLRNTVEAKLREFVSPGLTVEEAK